MNVESYYKPHSSRHHTAWPTNSQIGKRCAVDESFCLNNNIGSVKRMPIMDIFANFFSPSFQQSVGEPATACAQFHDAVFNPLPASHQNINAVLVKNNLAIIPGEWESGDLSASHINPSTAQPDLTTSQHRHSTTSFPKNHACPKSSPQ